MKLKTTLIILALSAAPAFAFDASHGAQSKTREEVKAELSQALRSGDIMAGGEIGAKVSELNSGGYQLKTPVLGKTRDDAAGEALDKAGRTLGLPYPGGISIDKISPTGDENAFAFPHPRLDTPYDFSFSGLKTAVINTVHRMEQKGETLPVADLAASFQKGVTDCLVEKLEKAATDYGYTSIALAGGVSANSRLRRETDRLCRQKGWQLHLPALKYCGDNGAMVGAQGYYEYVSGVRAQPDLNAYATMPIDRPTF